MASFALIAEGITDFAVLEAALSGHFKEDISQHINELQPPLDATDNNRQAQGVNTGGGWEKVLQYIQHQDFKDALESSFNDYVVVQIDTDVSHLYGVEHPQTADRSLDIPSLIAQVKAKLLNCMAVLDPDLYTDHQEKIIFAICVHSIECWLVAHYFPSNNISVNSCEGTLKGLIAKKKTKVRKFSKDRFTYQKLARPLVKNNFLQKVIVRDLSLQDFISQLP